MSIADVDQRSRVRQLGVHEELLHRLGVVHGTIAADALDLRFVRSYDVVRIAAMACPARRAATSTLSTRRGLDGVWWRALVARRSIVERSKDTDTNLLELLALRRRLDVLEMH